MTTLAAGVLAEQAESRAAVATSAAMAAVAALVVVAAGGRSADIASDDPPLTRYRYRSVDRFATARIGAEMPPLLAVAVS
jgi:hypothetical protein